MEMINLQIWSDLSKRPKWKLVYGFNFVFLLNVALI